MVETLYFVAEGAIDEWGLNLEEYYKIPRIVLVNIMIYSIFLSFRSAA
jgi:hypothetical protein